jgi:LPS sulfotransferase NodH
MVGILPNRDTDSALADGAYQFVVIGAQRTGTNILRTVLNTNEEIAMLGEVMSPSAAPAHWDNFVRGLPLRTAFPENSSEAEAVLDQYFAHVQYRIRNHWDGNRKSRSRAIGLDIKYNQLRRLRPPDWDSASSFILSYLQSNDVILIHTTRNVIHSAISALIAEQRNVWHNYRGVVIDRSYSIDVEECLACARAIVQDREAFLKSAHGSKIVDCRYESLIEDLARAGFGEEIPEAPGPLRDITEAFGIPFKFTYDRRLQKAIDVPYSKLLSNFNAVTRRMEGSEFAPLVPTLE